MLKKTLLILLALLFLVTTLTLASYKEEYTLSYNVGPDFPWGMGADYFTYLVRERTQGRINIVAYGGSSLAAGQQTSLFMLVRRGAIDMALESTINWSPQMRELNLFTLPFFFKDYSQVDAVQEGEFGKTILERMERLGVIPFGWGENGFREITNNRRPIHRPEDLSDLKYRVVGSRIFTHLFLELGSNPLTMNWVEVTTGFQQGAVDGQENPVVNVLIPLRIWEFHAYMTKWGATIDPLLLGINEQVFNSFTSEDQVIIAQAAEEALLFQKMLARYGLDDGTAKEYIHAMIEDGSDLGYAREFLSTWQLSDGTNDPMAFLKSQGMQINTLTEEERALFKAATEETYNKWVEIIGYELVEMAIQDIEAAE